MLEIVNNLVELPWLYKISALSRKDLAPSYKDLGGIFEGKRDLRYPIGCFNSKITRDKILVVIALDVEIL